MTLAELRQHLEARAIEADAQRATAPLGDTLRWLLAELATANDNGNGHAPESPDMLLTARQVAPRLNCSVRYVYARAKDFPFTVRLSPEGPVRFSAAGLDRWLARTR